MRMNGVLVSVRTPRRVRGADAAKKSNHFSGGVSPKGTSVGRTSEKFFSAASVSEGRAYPKGTCSASLHCAAGRKLFGNEIVRFHASNR